MNFETLGTQLTAFLGGVGIAILALIGAMRRERMASAKADATIAAAHGEEAKHEGQAAEIERLAAQLKKVSEIQAEQGETLAHHSAIIIGLEAHFHSMLLCEKCQEVNKNIIDRILDAFIRYRKKHEHH